MSETNVEILHAQSEQLKLEFEVGSKFTSIQEFVDLFTKTSVLKSIYFIVKQRNKKTVSLCCKNTLCSFKKKNLFK